MITIMIVEEPVVILRPKDKRPDEPIDNKRARLLYQSRKRGIKENDLLMGCEPRNIHLSSTASVDPP